MSGLISIKYNSWKLKRLQRTQWTITLQNLLAILQEQFTGSVSCFSFQRHFIHMQANTCTTCLSLRPQTNKLLIPYRVTAPLHLSVLRNSLSCALFHPHTSSSVFYSSCIISLCEYTVIYSTILMSIIVYVLGTWKIS